MEQKLTKRVRLSTLAYSFLAALILVFTLTLVCTYFFPRTSSLVETLVRKVPYPAVVIDYRKSVSFRELSQNMDSVKRFYENQDFSKLGLRVDFSTEEGKKRLKIREKEVLNKMIEDQAMVILAQKRDIFVTMEMAHQGVTRKIQEYGSEERVKTDLDRLYGWGIADFEKKIVLPSLYEEKLKESFLKEVEPAKLAQQKIEKAAETLRGGASFNDVVKQYSDGKTVETDGDLGWFSLADLASELRAPVALQKVGTPGNVIESNLGFHIVLVEELKAEKGGQLYRLRQIFSRKETFADWLLEKMQSMSFIVLAPEYIFDKSTGRIEFKDVVWRTFEEELYKQASGDPSLLY